LNSRGARLTWSPTGNRATHKARTVVAQLLDYVLQHKRFYGTTFDVIDVQICMGTAFCIIL